MKSLFIKRNLSVILFVAAGLAVLLIIGTIYIAGRLSLISLARQAGSVPDRYNLHNDFEQDDPYITKVPQLGDMLSGPIISARDPGIGDDKAPVVIVVFSDFTCQYCRAQEEALNRLLDKYPTQVRIIRKDYPETNIDSPSWQAAVAARCAQEQDKFWPYHDLLYSYSGELSGTVLLNLAGEAGLDRTRYLSCLDSGRSETQINDNIAEANALRIGGVPFIYVNDQEIMGEASFEDLEQAVLKEIDNY